MSTRFSTYAWFVTAFNVLVIAWGSVVRATGSGAGCGNHWPQCNGVVIPDLARVATAIEFGHRLSSSLAGIFVAVLLIWAIRRRRLSHPLTLPAAILSVVFLLVEAFVGALLVRLELVANNASALRAVVIALHLVNTLLLLGSLALAAWSGRSTAEDELSLTGNNRDAYKTPVAWLLPLLLVLTAILSAAGAVTALGDTLFPSQTLAAGIGSDFDSTASWLIRLRVIHPLIAVGVVGGVLVLNQWLLRAHPSPMIARVVRLLYALVGLQFAAGLLNVALLAPVWMQVLHLILADTLWLALVVLACEVYGRYRPVAVPAAL